MSNLVLGTVQWGMPYGIANGSGQPSGADVAEMLRAAGAEGVAVLDTAQCYGTSEDVIGELIGPDPKWTVLTKVDPDVVRGDDVLATAESSLERSIAESRRRLRRPVLDGVMFHRAEHRHAFGGHLWRRLVAVRAEGCVRSVGVSVGSVDEALDAVADDALDCVQVPMSALDQRTVRAGFFDVARARAKKVYVRSALLQGALLLDPQALPSHLVEIAPVLSRLASIAQGQGRTLLSLLLAYARDATGCDVVVGAERPAQLLELLKAWNEPPLTSSTLAMITSAVPDLPDTILNPSRWPK